jgi:isoleucyl-tRNA synthetase
MSETRDPGAADYRATLFLPQTEFPMKAGLPSAEPKWLARWEAMNLYGRIRAQMKGQPQFILHDGPPYANGEIHSGTGLNKILKDFVVRSRTMMGFDAPYVPGWDCHGLPIEWKIEEKYRKDGKSKDSVPVDVLRKDCREFALKWIDVQREQFKRLGVMGVWDRPYMTMDFAAEATIAGELHKFVANGLLYRGFRPVMWSPVEKTALAEAEVEYHDKQSLAIWVKFPIHSLNTKRETIRTDLAGVSVVIWTTTPWTIPANRAIAFSPTMEYGLYEVVASDSDSVVVGEKLLLADVLADQTAKQAKIGLKRLGSVNPEGLVCTHPFHDGGYNFTVPLLPGDHVTADTGTGFVHTAPGHGEDDYELYKKHKDRFVGSPDPFDTVSEEGALTEKTLLPSLIGKRILLPKSVGSGKDKVADSLWTDLDPNGANVAVIKELAHAGKLLAKGKITHSYPHSWRSKAPVIFRATPQWFAGMDREFEGSNGKTLRQLAVAGIENTKWYPAQGQNRIGAMVEGRPDWVLSRQRAWGVPLAIFVEKATGKILNDPAVNARIIDAFKLEGADAWFTSDASRFLGTLNPDDYEQVKDILDVWFDSGSTHVFTVEQPIHAEWPRAGQVDLYLEGSDQHRGWFQSSLLETCATTGHAPYKAVLTHGFVLDAKGLKMSKSLGNTVLPQTIADQNGAEILRLWAASSDFTEDLRIGPDIIKSNVDAYRRLRNTIRFMLANLAGFDDAERIAPSGMPELERYILAKLAELDGEVRRGYGEYDFNFVYNTVFSFCTNELSAFYFDIRKDSLYCDAITAPRRRAVRTVIDETFRRVVTWLAPMLCFTMEEAWLCHFPGDGNSVHLQTFPATPAEWLSSNLIGKWNRIRALRRVVTGALEVERREKRIGASLEAAPTLFISDPLDTHVLSGLDLAEICITSAAAVSAQTPPEDAFRLPEVPGVAAAFHPAQGEKCARCWMILPEVGHNQAHKDLCNRCASVVETVEKT